MSSNPSSGVPVTAPGSNAILWIIALVAVIGGIGLAVWATSLRGDLASANDRIAALVDERNGLRQAATASTHELSPTAQGPPSASGTIYLTTEGSGVLNVVNMPAPEDGAGYQVWFLPDNEGAPVPGAMLPVDERGVGFVLIPADSGNFRGISISQEPVGGSEAPSGPMLLAGSATGARG